MAGVFTQLAKMSIDPEFIELTADVFRIVFLKYPTVISCLIKKWQNSGDLGFRRERRRSYFFSQKAVYLHASLAARGSAEALVVVESVSV